MVDGAECRGVREVATVTALQGYAVVDTETTGIHPGYHHRIAEIAIVHLDLEGNVTDEWCTLVNPQRDLGPQTIHGIRAADVRRAPTFERIAAELARRFSGRIPVAHNWPFDASHLTAEFARLGIVAPFDAGGGICTMSVAGRALPHAGRSLMDCCRSAGLAFREWHTALADARAASALFGYLLGADESYVTWTDSHLRCASWLWPSMPTVAVTTVRRAPRDRIEPHFLARMVDRMPRTGVPKVDAYLAMLDGALLDRNISDTEADALIALAYEIGLHRAEIVQAHHNYLRTIARTAWADGVITGVERADLMQVADLLGLGTAEADQIIATEASPGTTPVETGTQTFCPRGLVLTPGMSVVLTGAMKLERTTWTQRARTAGLIVCPSVTRKTELLVAADPDTLSGKAKQARLYKIPVVSEDAFASALDDLQAR
jgi:DNA polymerase III subunit epsilon